MDLTENKHNLTEVVLAKKIHIIRGHKVMMDSDLAEIYSVTTKRFNEQVKRNKDRFPQDFMFQLTREEKAWVVANCDHLSNLKYSPHPPDPGFSLRRNYFLQ